MNSLAWIGIGIAVLWAASFGITVYYGFQAGRSSAFHEVAEDFARIADEAKREAYRRMTEYDERWS